MIKDLVLNAAEKVDGETFRWVVSGLLGLITSIGAMWLSHLHSRLDNLSEDISDKNQRISVLETHVDGFNKRLDRIESKIDYLVQEKSKRS